MTGDTGRAAAVWPQWCGDRCQAWLLLTLVSGVCVVVQWVVAATPTGHDVAFHLPTWIDAAAQGRVLPRWPVGANFGFGDARFIFYPPLSWLIGSALCRVLPLGMVAGAYVFLCLLLCGLGLYGLASNFLGHRRSLLAGTLFVLSPYLTWDVYRRTAYGELLAIAILVFAIHYAIRLHRSHSRRDLGLLSLSLGLLWLANVPMALIGSICLMSLTLARWRRDRRALVLAGPAIAAGLAAGVSACYTFGILEQREWVGMAALPRMQGGWRDFLLPAPLLVIAAVQVAAAAALVRGLRARAPAPMGLRGVVLGLAVPAALMLTPVSVLVWRLPLLDFIQFPSRWLAILSILYGLAGGVMVSRAHLFRAIGGGVVVYLCCVGLSLGSIRDASPLLAQTRLAIDSGEGYEAEAPEWRPRGFAGADDRPLVFVTDETGSARSDCASQVDAWEADRKVVRMTCPVGGVAHFRVAYYPLWTIRIDGVRAEGSADAIGALQCRVEGGHRVIDIHFERSTVERLAALVSVVAGAAIILLAV